MKKLFLFTLPIFMLASCASTDYTVNVAGVSDNVTIVIKDFVTLGIVTVRATEIHHSGPLGFNKSVTGSKLTYADFMHEAAKLEADDIINIRIDVHHDYIKRPFGWITGWTRTFNYTGTGLAIKYTERLEAMEGSPQFGTLPRTPEITGAVRTTRSGKVEFR